MVVSDVSRVEPLDSGFFIEVEAESPPAPPGGGTKPPGSSLVGIPNIQEVKRDQWMQHRFDEESALELKRGEDDSLDIFVNMDNIHLRNEIVRRRTMKQEMLNQWFKYGLSILALGMLYKQQQEDRPEAGSEAAPEAEAKPSEDLVKIAEASRGLAMTIIPVIAQLSRERPRSAR